MRKLLLPILVFALVLSSCTDDLTSLNEDPKSTTEAPGDPLFSNAQVSLGTLQNTPNYNINIFKFMSQYWAQTTYNDETMYDLTNRTIPSSYWSELYRDVLKDADDASRLVEEDELMPDAEKQNKQAQIEIVKVLAYYKLVTTFGDIPYDEALDSENLSPAYTNDEDVYVDLLNRLEKAAGNINTGEPGFASADVFYGGDLDQWVKFAHSLRMRLAMSVVDNPPSGVDPQAIVEDASPQAFQENGDNALVQFTNTPPHTNPVWENLIQNGRDDFVAADTYIDKMNDLNDPRRPIHFTRTDTNTVDGDPAELAYVGGPYGAPNSYGDYSHMDNEGDPDGDPPTPLQLSDFEGMIMSYDEVEFLRAEAAVRGWSVSGTATTHYNNAVTADMEYWSGAVSQYQTGGDQITSQEITDYLTNDAPFPAVGSDTQKLEAIATQKWLAFYPIGQQAWVDYRRFDHPTFNTAANGGAETEDDIPVRFTYPIDEQNLNQANYDEASSSIGGDATSTFLFWDVRPASDSPQL